jgi:uncharacterized protein YfaS (alpha-2-macroglobulin family)
VVASSADIGRDLDPGELPISISPPVKGIGRWLDESAFVYNPSYLSQATSYKVTIDEKLSDLNGNLIKGNRVFELHTSPLEFMGVRQTFFDADEGFVDYDLMFSFPVNPSKFAGFLSIKNAKGQIVPLNLKSPAASQTIAIRVKAEDGSPVSLRIAKGLTSEMGPLGLEKEIQMKVERNLTLKILQSYAISQYDGQSVYLEMSSKVDAAYAKSFVEITPPSDFRLEAFSSTLKIAGSFKPRERVTVRLRKGLPSVKGSPLEADWVRSFVFPDVEPALYFPSQGRFISHHGESIILPIASVNIEKINVDIRRIYDNNVSFALLESWPYQVGYNISEGIFNKDYLIEANPNEEARNSLDLKKILNDRKGLFGISLADKDFQSRVSTTINVTDIAGSVKLANEGLLAWANSISSARPLKDVNVKVYSSGNQLLCEGRTNSQGVWEFKRPIKWDQNLLPHLAVFSNKDDVSLLLLDYNIRQRNDSAFEGVPYSQGEYQAMCFTPRGVFRPGERVPVNVLLRDKDLGLKEPFPVRIKVTTPQSREWKSSTHMLSPMGIAATAIILPDAAPTGKWAIEVFIPGEKSPAAYGSFLVEEFAPPRINVNISSDKTELYSDEEIPLFLSAQYLFGSPADGLNYEVTKSFIPRKYSNPKWANYEFSDERISFSTESWPLAQGTLSASGDAVVAFDVPKLTPPSILDISFRMGVMQDNGRWVYKTLTLPYFRRDVLLGIMPPPGGAQSGGPVPFAFAALAPSGEPLSPSEVELSVLRREWRIIRTMDDSGENSEMQAELVPIDGYDGNGIVFNGGKASLDITFPAAGEYLVALNDKDSGASASVALYVYGSGWNIGASALLPEKLEITLDKDIYKPGERARARVSGAFDGTILLTVETDEILHYETAETKNKEAEFTLRVTEGMKPNAWVTAHLVRPAIPEERWSTHRSFGALPLSVDCSPMALGVDLSADGELRPRAKNEFSLQIEDSSGNGVEGEVIVTLVDEGVLSLTNFTAPDPYDYFTKRRRLDLSVFDAYDDLLPLLEKTPPLLTPGGDGLNQGLSQGEMLEKISLSPVRADRFKVLTLWKKVIAGKDGKAAFSFVLPEFSGKVRLMAFAVSKNAFGASEKFFTVSRKLVVEQSFPRAAAPGDSFESQVLLFNKTERSLDVDVQIKADGPVYISNVEDEEPAGRIKAMTMKVELPPSESAFEIPLLVDVDDEAGVAKVSVAARYDGSTTTSTTEMPVRPPFPWMTQSETLVLKPGDARKIYIPDDWMYGTRLASISMSGLPEISLADAALFLLNYPYSCLEQTVSSAWVLLSLPEITSSLDPNLATRTQLSSALAERIGRIQALQLYNGAFTSWPGGLQSDWNSIYASHLLITCEKRGIPVNKETVNASVEYVRRLLAISPEAETDEIFASQLGIRSYAAYVISLREKPPLAWMSYLKDNIDHLPDYGRILLAAAFARGGQKDVARVLLGDRVPPIKAFEANLKEGPNLDSERRNLALYLLAWNEVDPASVNAVNSATELLIGLRRLDLLTTQDAGFALPALADFYSYNKNSGSPILEVRDMGSKIIAASSGDVISSTNLAEGVKSLTVKNNGTGNGYVSWVSGGVPLKTPPPEDRGLRVRAEYSDSAGILLPANPVVKKGQKIIGKVRLVPLAGASDNIVVILPLPGGLEVENPRLMDVLNESSEYNGANFPNESRVELRDDRLLIFVDKLEKPFEWIFSMRAVTPGKFVFPPVSAEGMYSPGVKSISAISDITILRK